MEAELFYKIHQLDGRIENYHFYVNDVDIALDLLNEITPKTQGITQITERIFWHEKLASKTPTKKLRRISVHKDLYEPSDAMGEKVGYLEHYQL